MENQMDKKMKNQTETNCVGVYGGFQNRGTPFRPKYVTILIPETPIKALHSDHPRTAPNTGEKRNSSKHPKP